MSSTIEARSPATGGGGDLPSVRVAIVGSGFSGLGMAIRLAQAGVRDFVILERADDVGGTWRDNTYPGCQCDVPSHLYSFSFAPNPDWSRTYSRQPEIWDYLRRCMREHELEGHLRLGCEVTDAQWIEDLRRWRLETSDGPLLAQVLVGAMGPLSEPALPELPGAESFAGRSFHSARWEHDHDLSGRRVAVIGTGASAIQFIPRIQREVGELLVFQRTPAWVLPHTDRPVSRFEKRLYRRLPAVQRLVRAAVYWAREALVPGFTRDQRLMRAPELLARAHLRRQVRDPELRRLLNPSYRLGCKRILLSDHYYPALTKPNVRVMTESIRELRPEGIVTADGTLHEVDTIIYGTGFHVTDSPVADHVRGRDGRTLTQAWRGSPEAYLGTAIAGFPNLFMMIGPNTGLGHNSMVYMIESQLRYVVDCVLHMERDGLDSVEVRPEVQAEYNAELQRRMPRTVWMSGCASWYIDANGRNTTAWPDFTWRFRQRTRRFEPAAFSATEATHAPVRA